MLVKSPDFDSGGWIGEQDERSEGFEMAATQAASGGGMLWQAAAMDRSTGHEEGSER